MSWWIILFITLMSIWIISIITSRKRRKFKKINEQLKTKHWDLPFIGQSYVFLGTSEERMNTMKKIGEDSYEKGGIAFMWFGNRLYYTISDPEPAEEILKNCLEKADEMNFLRNIIGNGSIFAPGENDTFYTKIQYLNKLTPEIKPLVPIWRPRRKIMAPTFSLKNLNYFVRSFAKQSSIMVKKLEQNAGNGTFAIWKFATTYTMDAVCETTLGTEVHAQKHHELPLLQAFQQLFKINSQRCFQLWLHSDKIFRFHPAYTVHCGAKKLVVDYVGQIVDKNLAKHNNESNENTARTENGGTTLLELLLKSFKNCADGFGKTELLEESLVIFFAGTDTSAVGLSFTAVMLSRYQAIQERCYEELMEVFGESDRPVGPEDLTRLKYLDAVIRETLRVYPPIPFITRYLDKNLTLPSGVTLEEGSSVVISIFAIHRNPKYWGEDAEQFRPERFLDAAPKHPAAFIPFNHAQRACTGYQYAMMSMKTSLATLLRSYRLLPAISSDGTHKPLRLKYEIMMKDVDNFKLRLEKRKRRTLS